MFSQTLKTFLISNRFLYVPDIPNDVHSLVLKFSYSMRIKTLQNANWQNQITLNDMKIFEPDATSCNWFFLKNLGNIQKFGIETKTPFF